MASVTFKRGTKAEIESTQIQDGQLLMETDQLNNNKIYLDLPNGTRVPVGGSGAWVGTKEEFEVAVEEGKIADGTQVIITDDYESGITASMTLYSNVQGAIDELNSNLIKCKRLASTTNGGGGIHIQTASGISPNKVIAITLVDSNLEIYPVILDNGFVVIKKISGEHYINSEVTLNVWYIN